MIGDAHAGTLTTQQDFDGPESLKAMTWRQITSEKDKS